MAIPPAEPAVVVGFGLAAVCAFGFDSAAGFACAVASGFVLDAREAVLCSGVALADYARARLRVAMDFRVFASAG